MRLQKEEKIAIILLMMALGSLAIAAWTFGSSEQSMTAKVESSASVEGTVLEMNPTKSGGNLLIQLDSTSAAIFIPQDSGAQEIMDRIHIGDRIRVKGKITDFHGSEEIKIDRVKDIEVIAAGEKQKSKIIG